MSDHEHMELKKQFVVLINAEAQYSLWPDFIKIPLGWQKVYGPSNKETCLDYVRENWLDMRPLSSRS